MIPHVQTLTVGNEFGAPGNCMQAVVASLLDLPMERVPHFALFDDWRRAVALWLEGIDKKLEIHTDRGAGNWERANVPVWPRGTWPGGRALIAAGDSPNGDWSHVVVWKDREVLHDPHPLAKGLAGEPWEFWNIRDAYPSEDFREAAVQMRDWQTVDIIDAERTSQGLRND